MAQKPTLTPSTLATTRDPVVKELFGWDKTFSNLASGMQSVITDIGEDAFMRVTEQAKYYAELNPASSDLPTEWNELFKAIWIANGHRHFRSVTDFHAYWTTYVAPLQQRIADHYTADWLSTSVESGGATYSVESIRKSVIAMAVRQRTPVFVPVHQVDQAISEEFVKLWEGDPWDFRKAAVKLTIAANGEITEKDGHAYSGLASRELVLPGGKCRIKWADSSEAAELAAKYDGCTGQPVRFTDSGVNGFSDVTFYPTPDKEYTAYATVFLPAPSIGSSASSSTALDKLPHPFRAHLRDRVLARLLSEMGREDTDASRALARVRDEYERLANKWQSKGFARRARPANALGYMAHLTRGGVQTLT